MKKKHFKVKIIAIIVIVILFIYSIIGNIIVSAALVPDFMRKLEAFEKVTEKSYSEMVRTDEITKNTAEAREEAMAFLEKAELRKIKTVSYDGYDLIASCFKQPKPDKKPWVVLLHGYTGWKEEMYHYAARYYEEGFNILCPDLRCQGESDGDFIGMGWRDRGDVMLWINKILESYPEAKVVVHGESMGASCALMLTDLNLPENVKCIVSDCAMEDSVSMFRKQLRDWFSMPDLGFITSARIWLKIRGGYDLKKASALDVVSGDKLPTLFIHGDNDRIVPVSDAEDLYEACGSKVKDIMIVEGAGHAQSCYKDPEAYYDRVFSFIDPFVGKNKKKTNDEADAGNTSDKLTSEELLGEIPGFSGVPFVYLNDNVPEFAEGEIWTRPQEYLSQLDKLGRCGIALSCIGRETMPEGERGYIRDIYPSGWQYDKYDFVEGEYLYNRCHMVGYQLSGNDAVDRNLLTGTRYMNVEGMLPFENAIADYVRRTGNHVMYRVTPVFYKKELVARGVHLEALSVEDKGRGLAFNVYCYNEQPGVDIDHATGKSSLSKDSGILDKYEAGEFETDIEICSLPDANPGKITYVLNTKSMKFHYEGCKNAIEMASDKKETVTTTRKKLIEKGYEPCGWCRP